MFKTPKEDDFFTEQRSRGSCIIHPRSKDWLQEKIQDCSLPVPEAYHFAHEVSSKDDVLYRVLKDHGR
jgi:hypothetical protein